MSIEPFMQPPSGVVSCDECGRRRPEHAPTCSRFVAREPASPTSHPAEPGPAAGDHLPLPEMLDLLAEAKDRRDAVGARIARPGGYTPENAAEMGEAQVDEWRIVDEIVDWHRTQTPTETDRPATDYDEERRRLTAPLAGVDNIAHRVTLRVLAERPNDPQVQEQWAGRLQGMAMAGLVWRFPDGPWRITAYGRSLLAAEGTTVT